MLEPPDVNRLSRTVVSAELLRGNLVRCGPGARGVGWPDSPRVRSHAVSSLQDLDGLVAVLGTAAWIWGAGESPTEAQTFSTYHGARYLRTPAPGVRVHEFMLDPRDTVWLGSCWVTSRHRTLYDLLYLDDARYERYGLEAARYLFDVCAPISDTLVTQFHGRNRPHSVRAHERLAELARLSR